MRLSGKIVFISGGGGGIGGGIAQAFAEQGARIVLADVNTGFAEEEASKLLAGGAEVEVVALDVADAGSWASAREFVVRKLGGVDVLCNNAGVSSGYKPLIDVEPRDFARLMSINVAGVYNGIRAFAPQMIERGSGHIVNTSSMNGLLPFGSFAAYAASKFAVLGLSDSLREELAPKGVGVSTLFPGLTRSRMSESDLEGPLSSDPGRAAAIRANMMEPVWLGRAVVRAVEQNDPYIVTHPAYRSALEQRFKRLLVAFGEPAQPGYITPSSSTNVLQGM